MDIYRRLVGREAHDPCLRGLPPALLSLRHERQRFLRKLRARNFLLERGIFDNRWPFLHRGRVVHDQTTTKKRQGIAVYWCNGRRCSPL